MSDRGVTENLLLPEERVRLFIADFTAWKNQGGSVEDDQYLPESVLAHFSSKITPDSPDSYDIAEQNHHPEWETVHHTAPPGNRKKIIVTTVYSNPDADFIFDWREYHYHLKKGARGWLIDSIECFDSDSPAGPLAGWSIEKLTFVEKVDLATAKPSTCHFEKIFNPQPDALLSDEQTYGERRRSATTRSVGTIEFPSGTIAIWDGSSGEPSAPFSLKVPTTKAKITLALLGDTIGSVRFEFGDVEQIVSHVEATQSGKDYIPRGIVGIGDGNDLSHTSLRTLEPMFKQVLAMASMGPANKRPVRFQFFDLNPNYPKGGFVFDGWNGDRPRAYWGVDAKGFPIALVLHFPGAYFLTEQFIEKAEYSKKDSGGFIQTETMKAHDLKIAVKPDGTFEPIDDEHHARRFRLEEICVVTRSGIGMPVVRLPDRATVRIQWSLVEDV